MKRVETTLAERLGSVAWRYQSPLTTQPPLHAWAWMFARELEEDAPVGDGPTARREREARVEAVLFLAREPLGSRKLAELADLADGTEARTLVRKLNRLYDNEGCAFRAIEVAGGFQLLSRPQFAPYLRRLHGPAVEVRLSAPAMETLAVVAYRQPVLRASIESVRGVQCGELLRQLMERDLVRIAGRSEELGRPFLYGTTKRFLQVFGLRHIDELPPAEMDLAVDGVQDTAAVEQPGIDGQCELATPSDESPLKKEESTVRIAIEGQEIPHPDEDRAQAPASGQVLQAELDVNSSFDDEEDEEYEYEYEDDDDYDEEDEFDDDDDEEEEEEEEEDDGFEDPEWEEVEDDEEEEWDDDDWGDEDEDDWGEDEDESEEGDEDWN